MLLINELESIDKKSPILDGTNGGNKKKGIA
jgi:hypothetical protein